MLIHECFYARQFHRPEPYWAPYHHQKDLNFRLGMRGRTKYFALRASGLPYNFVFSTLYRRGCFHPEHTRVRMGPERGPPRAGYGLVSLINQMWLHGVVPDCLAVFGRSST
jgi:hypothetical protein